jgi:ankyrin repeat protein
MTPLSLAADQGFEDIVRLLLDRGAIIAITSAVSKPIACMICSRQEDENLNRSIEESRFHTGTRSKRYDKIMSEGGLGLHPIASSGRRLF